MVIRVGSDPISRSLQIATSIEVFPMDGCSPMAMRLWCHCCWVGRPRRSTVMETSSHKSRDHASFSQPKRGQIPASILRGEARVKPWTILWASSMLSIQNGKMRSATGLELATHDTGFKMTNCIARPGSNRRGWPRRPTHLTCALTHYATATWYVRSFTPSLRIYLQCLYLAKNVCMCIDAVRESFLNGESRQT